MPVHVARMHRLVRRIDRRVRIRAGSSRRDEPVRHCTGRSGTGRDAAVWLRTGCTPHRGCSRVASCRHPNCAEHRRRTGSDANAAQKARRASEQSLTASKERVAKATRAVDEAKRCVVQTGDELERATKRLRTASKAAASVHKADTAACELARKQVSKATNEQAAAASRDADARRAVRGRPPTRLWFRPKRHLLWPVRTDRNGRDCARDARQQVAVVKRLKQHRLQPQRTARWRHRNWARCPKRPRLCWNNSNDVPKVLWAGRHSRANQKRTLASSGAAVADQCAYLNLGHVTPGGSTGHPQQLQLVLWPL